MGTVLFDTAAQQGLQFPQVSQRFTRQKRSLILRDPESKKICSAFTTNPREACLLFVGEPGCGKSSMARCVASAIKGEVHTVSSADCKLDALEIWRESVPTFRSATAGMSMCLRKRIACRMSLQNGSYHARMIQTACLARFGFSQRTARIAWKSVSLRVAYRFGLTRTARAPKRLRF